MEKKLHKGKLWHRIKYRNSIVPLPGKNVCQFARHLKRRHGIMTYIDKVVKRAKIGDGEVSPLRNIPSINFNSDIGELLQNNPSTSMSRVIEKNIVRRVNARGLEYRYPMLLKKILSEVKMEFLKITQESGISMKIKSGKKSEIRPYRRLGRTENYPVFVQHRNKLQSRFILHLPLIRRIFNECVTKLPYELLNLHASLKCQYEFEKFQNLIFESANDAAQRLQEFYRNIIYLVERDNTVYSRNYLSACTGLLSVNISRTIAHTLLHVANFVGSTKQTPYLKLNITFTDRLILNPQPEQIIESYVTLLKDLTDCVQQFYILEKYKHKKKENKQLYLSLTKEFFDSVIGKIQRDIMEKFRPILEFTENLNSEFLDIYHICDGENESADVIFEEGCEKIKYLRSYLPRIAFIADHAYFLIGQVNIIEYRETLKVNLLNVIGGIFENLCAQHQWENNDICEAFTMIDIKASQKPITTEELIEISKYMAWVRTEYFNELKERVLKALINLSQLIELGPLDETHILTNATAINWLENILPILEENNTTFEQLKFEAEEKLQKVIEEINIDIKGIYPLLDILDLMDDVTNIRNYLNSITLQMVKIKNVEQKIEWINREEVSLSFPKSTYAEYEELKNYVYPFYRLLKLCLNIQRNLSVWLDGQLDLINYEEVTQNVKKYHKEFLTIQKVYRNKLRQAQDENLCLRFKGTVDDPDMLNWPAPLKLCFRAIKLIEDFEPSLTIIKIMCNEALMKRHWEKMSLVAGFDITPNAGTTLRKLIKFDLKPNLAKYELISYFSTKEKALIEELECMQTEWANIDFRLYDHEETKRITGFQDIQVIAEDHIMKVINMLNSIYVQPHYTAVKCFHKNLLKIVDTVKEFTRTQRELIHLSPLFLCPEIAKHMTGELNLFQQVSNTYTNYVDAILTKSNVFTIVNNTNLMEDLIIANQQLDLINLGISDYFTKIRQYFLRFYYVSDQELFTILSLTKTPIPINQTIKLLFNIKEVEFDDDYAIIGIKSTETLNFTTKIDTKISAGCVEKWLKELENNIIQTLKTNIEQALTTPFTQIIQHFPYQVVFVVTKILFAVEINQHMAKQNYVKLQQNIHKDIETTLEIFKNTDNQHRVKISSIVLTLAHHRDILTKLQENNNFKLEDFEWMVQLRYYQEATGCKIKILDMRIDYGYNFNNEMSQIVITPTTERVYHSLLFAYKHYRIGGCISIESFGKTTNVQNLALALGTYCAVMYCSTSTNPTTILNFLKGAVQTGHWLCMEIFEKIPRALFSIIHYEVTGVLTALKEGLTSVKIKGTEMPLLHGCFITCNMKEVSGIPENFKVLLRPIYLIQPEVGALTQSLLLSYNYKNWKSLGLKLKKFKGLVTKFVSGVNFNFDIRTVKKILAKSLTLTQIEDEEQKISRAIWEVLTPSLSLSEMEVFETCLKQFFNFNISDETLLSEETVQTLTPELAKKLTMAKESISQRTSLIVLGKTYTGKSTLIHNLLSLFDVVNSAKIYTETLELDDFFGTKSTGGIIDNFLKVPGSWIILDCTLNYSVLDNFSSLLDQNGKLCKGTGDSVLLNLNTKIIIEVDNIDEFSPGLVSKCNVVYLQDDSIGWNTVVNSWVYQSKFEWHKNHESNFTVLFAWVAPACFEFLQTCLGLAETSQISVIKTATQILEMLLIEPYETIKRNEEDARNLSSWIQASFIQAIIWSIGSQLDQDTRVKFDDFFKNLWKGHNKNHPYPKTIDKVEVGLPTEGLIADHSYLYKSKGTWKFWPDALKNEKIEEFDHIPNYFVPTNDTIKYSYLVKMHIVHNYPVIFAGPPCSGKTSILSDAINKTEKSRYEGISLTFPVRTSAKTAQKIILSKLSKSKTGSFSAGNGKTSLLFIDDFHVDTKTKQVTEVLRQLVETKTFYDNSFKSIGVDNFNMILVLNSILTQPKLYQRFLRHFNIFTVNPPSEDSLFRIFSNILFLKWKKLGFASDIINTVNQIISATYYIYKTVPSLKSTLTWNFHSFTIVNFWRVIQVFGIIKKETADTNKKFFLKLWVHEIWRSLGDRLNDKDYHWLNDKLKFCISEYFKDEDFDNDLSKILFGSYLNQNCHFEETDVERLEDLVTNTIKDYNKNTVTKIDIVIFTHILQQLSKIARVLTIPNCNLIQLGTCGTGRETLVKIACIMYSQKYFNLQLSELRDKQWWQSSLKQVLEEAGGRNKSCVFFLKEEKILNEEILRDIDCLIRTGQIEFLYSVEETQELLHLVRSTISTDSVAMNDNPNSIILLHQRRCMENIHVIYSIDFNSHRLRNYLQTFKSFKHLCEISIFKKWPEEALHKVAQAWITNIESTADTRQKITSLFPVIHLKLEETYSETMITTGAYLHFLQLYVKLLYTKQKKILTLTKIYVNALDKMSQAAVQISEMQKALAEYQPQLELMTSQAIDMAKQIERETIEVEKASDLVKKDEEIANQQAAAAQILKFDCEADLAQAIPILEDAISALNTLKPTDITLVKSMKNPPDAIKLVMAAVCVIKDVKPDRIPDPSTGRKTLDYWGPSKRILGDMNFLQTLKDFDKDHIKPEIMVKIRKDYLPHKDFKPHIVAKASSAAEGLCKWIIAMDMYDKVAKEVAPKKEKLEKAEREYSNTIAILNEKKDEVARIEQRLLQLNLMLKKATRKQQKLQKDVDECERKLQRAQKLINGLSGEKDRWTTAVQNLEIELNNLPGDMFLCSACITYFGPFSEQQRQTILTTWLLYLENHEVSHQPQFEFLTKFDRDVSFDDWHCNKLPQNDYFLTNGVIVQFSKKWCLLTDPQYQGNNWIKTTEKGQNILVTKTAHKDFLQVFTDAVVFGFPVLIENVPEVFDPYVFFLFIQTMRAKNGDLLKFGELEVVYNGNFRLYLTTNFKFPEYDVQIYDKLTIVDFILNETCLDENFLNIVVEVEKPVLKKVRIDFQTQTKNNKESLNKIEENILKTLFESKTEILEDEAALKILEKSKILSKNIQDKQEQLQETVLPMNEFREFYKPVAKHTTKLYSTIFLLSKVDYLYQFSYIWFLESYVEAIQNAERVKTVIQRCQKLVETIRFSICRKILRSIRQNDVVIFLFLLCVMANSVKEDVFSVLFLGDEELGGPEWLSRKSWGQICALSTTETYKDLKDFFLENEAYFEEISQLGSLETCNLPRPYDGKLDGLIISCVLRPEKLNIYLKSYVSAELGAEYVDCLYFKLSFYFSESYISTPLLYICNNKNDPVESIKKFAEIKSFQNKLFFVSPNDFDRKFEEAKVGGSWLCVQNCHLLESWLQDLELKLEDIDYKNVHEDFRIWLTAQECNYFPVAMLERSVKIIEEPSNMFKEKVKGLYLNYPINSEEFYRGCPGKHEVFVKFLYSITVFHCVLKYRAKYGPYGWNHPYSFNIWDLFLTAQELSSVINTSHNLYQEVFHLLKVCTYGTYINNQSDFKLFTVYLEDLMRANMDPQDLRYGFPSKTDFHDYITHISNSTDSNYLEIVGLDENSSIIKDFDESKVISDSIKRVFKPTLNDNAGLELSDVIQDLLNAIPSTFDTITKLDAINIDVCLIINQELAHCNQLLVQVKSDLKNLQNSLNNSYILTTDLKELYNALSKNKVPESWLKLSTIKSESVPIFFRDLNVKVKYFEKFLNKEVNVSLKNFYRPSAFLTMRKLQYAKKNSIPISEINFQLISAASEEKKIVISDLALIGADWNAILNCLEEQKPQIYKQSLNGVSFIFTQKTGMFSCPLYQNFYESNSSNFISRILIKTNICSNHWIRRGVGLYCDTE